MIGQGWLKAKGSWVGRICRRSSTKWGHPPASLWVVQWPLIDPHLNLKRVSYLLWSDCGWILDQRRSSVSDASVEPRYFWTCSWNWLYYYYCQPFNSLMIAYWISGELAARCRPRVSGSQCDRSASIKQAVVSSHITISSLYCTVLITDHTNISEIWPLPLAIESNSLQLVYVYPRQ